MKFFPKRAAVLLAIGGCFAARAALTKWAENVDAASRLEAVFFRNVTLPGGIVPMRRPPKETRPDLTKLISASPNDAELYSLRALEDEQQLDFATAETDWKKYAEVATDKAAARLDLADFYHRRIRPREEFDALLSAAAGPVTAAESLLAPPAQTHWKILDRSVRLIEEARFDSQLAVPAYSQWMSRYPSESSVYKSYFDFAIANERFEIANDVITAYKRSFPKDEEYPIEALAELTAKSGTPDRAIQVYDRSFQPLWPDSLVKQYFDLLKQSNSLRAYLEKARAAVAANPGDLAGAARIFHYWRQQDNNAAADRALDEFRQRKANSRSAWTADELSTLAQLYERSHNYDQSAQSDLALYSLAANDDKAASAALGSLARLLLTAPEQAIRFGSGNLTLYRDVATMDPHPGFLNGALSLLLNGSDPADRFQEEEQNAGPYFRRAKGAELVALFESRFPTSPERAELREFVIDSYAVYGASDAVIRTGTKFLTDFPNASNRTSVALRVADAYARTNQPAREFAIYDGLLLELAKRANGVPLGALPAPKPKEGEQPSTNADSLRSPEYARVLDRYVARLVSLKRTRDALALYRREIDRNPADPGLYDTMAAFLQQNNMGAEIEAVYQRAIAQFQDRTWQHKLARWYLRQKRQADVVRLTRDVIKIFSGTELDAYFREIVTPSQPLGPGLYLQLNLYANQRFPHSLTFARNLLTAYSTAPTANMIAYDAILRRHWYDADDLRLRFFERLSKTGRLNAELAAIRTANAANPSPASARFLAEGEAWRGHFEAAAPMFLAVESSFPADREIGMRSAAVYRSLGTITPKFTDTAVAIEDRLINAEPRDARALTSLGEIQADREQFTKARAAWDRIPEIDPARADGYLEAATIFWDYYRYEDALRWIEEGRKRLKQTFLFSYEAGAIHENQHDYPQAIREYTKGAISQPGSNSEQRLLLLARRPELRPIVEQLTANLVSDRNPQPGMFQVRVDLLRNQNRRDDLEAFLQNVTSRTTSLEVLTRVENTARIDGLPKVQQASIEKQAALMTDPVEKLRLWLALARFEEGQGQVVQGAAIVDTLYRENPEILGIVRAAVDYHWRNKTPQRAVAVLEEAAGRASASYRASFLVEAARKATDAGEYVRARTIADSLLKDQPNQPEYVALKAATYARQGDDRGLRTYYEAAIGTLTSQHLTEQVAELRRALIPVLTRTKDYASAVDQYIEILNRFPEDESLAREAALYAQQNGMAARLRDYYVKTAAASPKDFHWPLLLGRIETQFEDYPSAIASYTSAAVVRPDRPEILKERLNLEERLLRFEEAAVSAQKLYDLTYRNPVWMVKLAELRARQSRNAEAVTALKKAWLDGSPDNASNFLSVAQKLESWNMLAEARTFAEEAVKRAPEESINIWARIVARQQQYDVVFAKLGTLQANAATQVAQTVGAIAAAYPPDAKAKFAAAIATQPLRITLAQAAGLIDLEVKWRIAASMMRPGTEASNQSMERVIEAQKQRLKFDELAGQLEAYDRVLPPNSPRHDIEIAEDYRAAANTAAELRTLQRLAVRHEAAGPILERYTQLLIAQPQRLSAAIASESQAATVNGMLNYVLQHAANPVAQQAISARGQKNGELWTNAYSALAGLYFSSTAAPIKAAFPAILGPMTVGARIGKPTNRDLQLAGDPWFYYGGRYAEYLLTTKQAGSEDYLPAPIEATPGRSDAYFTLAEFTGSAVDYQHALELNPARADVHDRLAVIASKSGRTADSNREWKLTLAALGQMMDRSHVPQTFWTTFSETLRHIGEAKQLPALRDDIDKILRVYIRRNSSFQIDGIFASLLAASPDPNAGVKWIADLSQSAADPVAFLAAIIDRPWIPDSQRNVLYRQILESARAHVSQTYGEQNSNAIHQLGSWEIRWATFLISQRDDAGLQTAATLLADARKQNANEREVIEMEVRLAARARSLPAQLAKYAEPIPFESLQNAANILRDEGDAASSRRIMEFVYTNQMKAGNLDQSTFLGLAEIKLEERDVPGAMALLGRMTLICGQPFSGLEPAAELLEKTHHPNEAAEFRATLLKAEPWRTATQVNTANPWDALPSAAAEREKALLAIIAADPQPTPPRLLLIHAAVELHHDALAVAVAHQLLPQYFREGSEFSPWLASEFLANLERSQRTSIARDLSAAEQRLGNTAAALLYEQIGQELSPTTPSQRRIAVLRTQIENAIKNDARRPLISDEIDQDRLVHPKVGVQ